MERAATAEMVEVATGQRAWREQQERWRRNQAMGAKSATAEEMVEAARGVDEGISIRRGGGLAERSGDGGEERSNRRDGGGNRPAVLMKGSASREVVERWRR